MVSLFLGRTVYDYTGCPLDFRYFYIRKYNIFLFYQIKHCLLKRMIPRSFGLVVLILQYFLEIWLNLHELSTAGSAVHKLFVVVFNSTDQWATLYGSQKSHYPRLKCHENEEGNDNDCVTTQPISILVSFFSEDHVLYLIKKNIYIFSNTKVTKIESSAFLGHLVYILP